MDLARDNADGRYCECFESVHVYGVLPDARSTLGRRLPLGIAPG